MISRLLVDKKDTDPKVRSCCRFMTLCQFVHARRVCQCRDAQMVGSRQNPSAGIVVALLCLNSNAHSF
jgi:hypothetical protein